MGFCYADSCQLDYTGGYKVACYLEIMAGISSRSVMSNRTVESWSLPCFLARASRFSCRHPRAITWDPLAMIFSAKLSPIPEVAPMTRTLLHGKGMLEVFGGFVR